MNITEKVKVGMPVIDLAQVLFEQYEIFLMFFAIYQCEEKPHFDEIKKENPRARRSAAKALQHTPDFVEPAEVVKCSQDFERIRQLLYDLKEIKPEKANIASYVAPGDESKIYVHEAMKLISKVMTKTKNGFLHIPLLDLDIPTDEIPSDVVFPYIKEVAQLLGVNSGTIVNSGRSYHLWGLELMTMDAWHDFMHRALLLDRIDRRWVGHRLLDGQANIRVSPKWGKMPVVSYVF